MPAAFHSREFLSRHLKDRVYERAVSPAAPPGARAGHGVAILSLPMQTS
jgi:hypothetical protein